MIRPINITLFVTVMVVVGLVVGALQSKQASGPIRLKPEDGAIVAKGRTIYANACASCHGTYLEGETPNWRQRKPDGRLPAPPHDATGHTWHHTDQLLFELTKHGLAKTLDVPIESNMPSFADQLSDDDIIAALSFIKAQWPQVIRQRHDRLNAMAQSQTHAGG